MYFAECENFLEVWSPLEGSSFLMETIVGLFINM